MSAEGPPRARAPFTIPLADGPVAAWLDRAVAAFVALLAAAALLLLLRTAPNAQGYDTHTQLGMAPCGWPRTLGIPCPTCGCTTAASHVVHGELLRAFAVQPFGALLTIAGLLLGGHAALCLLRRRSFVDLLVRVPPARVFAAGSVVLLLSWYYKYLTFAP